MSKLVVGNNTDSFIGFIDTCMITANQHAPYKQKHVQGYYLPFLNKALSKEIIARESNRFVENRNEEKIYENIRTNNITVFLVRER